MKRPKFELFGYHKDLCASKLFWWAIASNEHPAHFFLRAPPKTSTPLCHLQDIVLTIPDESLQPLMLMVRISHPDKWAVLFPAHYCCPLFISTHVLMDLLPYILLDLPLLMLPL